MSTSLLRRRTLAAGAVNLGELAHQVKVLVNVK